MDAIDRLERQHDRAILLLSEPMQSAELAKKLGVRESTADKLARLLFVQGRIHICAPSRGNRFIWHSELTCRDPIFSSPVYLPRVRNWRICLLQTSG